MGRRRSKRNSLRSYVQYPRKPLKTRKIPPGNLKRLHTTTKREGSGQAALSFCLVPCTEGTRTRQRGIPEKSETFWGEGAAATETEPFKRKNRAPLGRRSRRRLRRRDSDAIEAFGALSFCSKMPAFSWLFQAFFFRNDRAGSAAC